MGVWINYKKEAFKKFKIDFVKIIQIFFELQADIGAGFMLLLCSFTVRKLDDIFLQWNKKYILLSILSGFVGVFMAQLCFCLGLTLSDAAFTAPWMLLNPIFTTILGLLLQYEKTQTLKTIGLSTSILGTIGLILLQVTVSNENNTQIYLATVFLFCNSMCNAFAVIIWKKLLVECNLSPLIVATWSLVVGSIFMLGAFCLRPYWFPWKEVQSLSVQFEGCSKILSCCFIIMLGYGVTYSIMTWATHKSSISIVALYASARPLFTVILSFIVDNKQETSVTVISLSLLFLVLFGLLASSHSKRKEKHAKLGDLKKKKQEALIKAFQNPPVGDGKISERPPQYKKIS